MNTRLKCHYIFGHIGERQMPCITYMRDRREKYDHTLYNFDKYIISRIDSTHSTVRIRRNMLLSTWHVVCLYRQSQRLLSHFAARENKANYTSYCKKNGGYVRQFGLGACFVLLLTVPLIKQHVSKPFTIYHWPKRDRWTTSKSIGSTRSHHWIKYTAHEYPYHTKNTTRYVPAFQYLY